MNFLFRILFLLLLTLVAACTNIEEEIADAPKAEEAVLHLCLKNETADSINVSRSSLTSSAPQQEVTTAYLYIFEGTEDNAPLVACENLYWGKGMVQKEYRIRHNLDKTNGTPYVLMAVGLDDASTEAYKLSATPETNLTETDLTLGTVRIEAKALAGVSESEFFVGESTVKYENGIFTQVGAESSMQYNQTPTVEMRRRVSGILLYVTDIPCDINSTKVTHLTLEVNQPQRKDLVLHRKLTSGSNTGQTSDDVLTETAEPFTEPSATESRTLITIPMPSDGYVAGGTYTVAAPAATDKVQRLENTWLKGIYLLPLENVELTLNLYGENNTTPLLSLPVYNEADSDTYTIHSNHIYSIGQKLTPDNTLDDIPISLAGDKIVLRPVDWADVLRNDTTEISTNENFFEPTDPYGLKLLTNDGKVSNADKYIFNCIANDEGKIRIRLPKPREGQSEATWELKISYPEKQDNGENNPSGWLYFKNGDTWTEAEGTFSGTGDIIYDLFMTDYAVKPSYVTDLSWNVRNGDDELKSKYDNDYRKALFSLSWTNPDGTSGVHTNFYIKQYNAIVILIESSDTDKACSAFSRLDVGDKFNIDGSCTNSAITHEWGFHGINNNRVFNQRSLDYSNGKEKRYLGLNNTANVKKSSSDADFLNSAVGKSFNIHKKISGDYLSIEEISVDLDYQYAWFDTHYDPVWYLPGAAELFFFLQLNAKLGGLVSANIKNENETISQGYWSSSPGDTHDPDVYYVYFDKDKHLNFVEDDISSDSKFRDEVTEPIDREDGVSFYLRQACILRN